MVSLGKVVTVVKVVKMVNDMSTAPAGPTSRYTPAQFCTVLRWFLHAQSRSMLRPASDLVRCADNSWADLEATSSNKATVTAAQTLEQQNFTGADVCDFLLRLPLLAGEELTSV